MIEISEDDFAELLEQAVANLKGAHAESIQNVAIIYQDEPTPDQRETLQLRHDQSLLGLYEGVPLSQRQGMTRVLPDKITLFKGPLSRQVSNVQELRVQIAHTLWHEIAHYYGLNHEQIRNLEL